MTKRDKLIASIVARPTTASFKDVQALLIMFGWKHASTKGSHARFTKAGERSITVPISNKRVKRFYLDQVCDRLGLDEETEMS